MITSIELENVRLFEGSGWSFPLSRLTVLCGMNSAGKSTILKILLLLRQSLGVRELTAKPRLRFSGTEVDLGSYSSFVSHNQVARDIQIGLGVSSAMPRPLWEQLRSLQSQQPLPFTISTNITEYVPYLLSCKMTFGFSRERQPQDSIPGELPEQADDLIDDAPRQERAPVLKRARFQISSDEEDLLSWDVSLVGSAPQHRRQVYEIRLAKSYVVASGIECRETESSGESVSLLTMLRGLIPDRILAGTTPAQKEAVPGDSDYRVWPLPEHIEYALRDLRAELARIQYLGPLRSPAKRYYTTQMDPDPVVDPAGDFLPSLLRERSDQMVWFSAPMAGAERQQESLLRALDLWLYYFRTGEWCADAALGRGELSLETFQDALLQLSLKSLHGSESHPVADSGFGYSQLLPILARGLMTRPASTLIVEQPEVHLNPALQVRVASFLVAMARAGKQVLVETHSEHIVNAVRVLSAEDSSDEVSLLSRILFLEAGDKLPVLHELSVLPDGTVPAWPKNFFGEAASLTGRLLRAQATSRRGASRQ